MAYNGRDKYQQNYNLNKNYNSWDNYKDKNVGFDVSSKETKSAKIYDCKDYIKSMFIESPIKQLTFTNTAWAKINCYINLIGDLEITGFGKVEGDKITDVRILKQSVKPAFVNSSPEAISEFIMSRPRAEIKSGVWCLDWHSHVNMGVFASGTDTANYKDIYRIRMNKPFPYMIINKSQDIHSKMYMGHGVTKDIQIYYDDTAITDDEVELIYNECVVDIEELCTEETYKTYDYDCNKSYNYAYDNYNIDEYKNNKELTQDFIDDNIEVTTDNKFACISCGLDLETEFEQEVQLCQDCIKELLLTSGVVM